MHLFMVYIYIDVDRVEMGGEINLKQSIIFFHMCMYTHIYIYASQSFGVGAAAGSGNGAAWATVDQCISIYIYIKGKQCKTI